LSEQLLLNPKGTNFGLSPRFKLGIKMTTATPLQDIANNLPIFTSREQKEQFLFVLGALTARIISLRKAAEVMNIDSEALLQILDLLGIEFSYLSFEDVEREKDW
jgi:hypothetical protein